MIKFTDLLKEDRKKKIYCDLDGVLVDFDKACAHITGGLTTWDWEKKTGKSFWAIMIKTVGCKKFYADMDWMLDGKDLWNYIKKYKPIILSACPKSCIDESRKGKQIWLKNNIPNTPAIIVSNKKEKKQYALGNILIDDYEINCSEWEENGGTAILHKNTPTTIKKLQKILGNVND